MRLSVPAPLPAVTTFVGALGALSVAFVAACSEPHVSLEPGTREYVASDYDQVLRRWTREDQLLSLAELENLLTVSATFESWDFRWAYVVRYAQDYRLTVEERRTLLQRTLADSREDHQFYVALYGANHRWDDLSQKNSAWTVRLIDSEGDETAPLRIEGIPKPAALERAYFPYTTVWRQAFRIHFPTETGGHPTIAANAKWFGLRFAGAEGGSGELHWLVSPKSGAKQTAFAPEGALTDIDTF